MTGAVVLTGALALTATGRSIWWSLAHRYQLSWASTAGLYITLAGVVLDADAVFVCGLLVFAVGEFLHQTNAPSRSRDKK